MFQLTLVQVHNFFNWFPLPYSYSSNMYGQEVFSCISQCRFVNNRIAMDVNQAISPYSLQQVWLFMEQILDYLLIVTYRIKIKKLLNRCISIVSIFFCSPAKRKWDLQIQSFVRSSKLDLINRSFIFGPPRSGIGTYEFTLVRPFVRPSELDLRIRS